MARAHRQTVDLSSYPDLVVVFLRHARQQSARLRTLLSYGPRINSAAARQPRGTAVPAPLEGC